MTVLLPHPVARRGLKFAFLRTPEYDGAGCCCLTQGHTLTAWTLQDLQSVPSPATPSGPAPSTGFPCPHVQPSSHLYSWRRACSSSWRCCWSAGCWSAQETLAARGARWVKAVLQLPTHTVLLRPPPPYSSPHLHPSPSPSSPLPPAPWPPPANFFLLRDLPPRALPHTSPSPLPAPSLPAPSRSTRLRGPSSHW